MNVRVVRKEWGLGGLRHKDDRWRVEVNAVRCINVVIPNVV